MPLGEASEAYEVDILSGSDGDAHARSVATPTALYAAADELADFGAPQSSLSRSRHQLSATVGRGFATRDVDPPGDPRAPIAAFRAINERYP